MPGSWIQEQAVATQQNVSTKSGSWAQLSAFLDPPRARAAGLAHLCGMKTTAKRQTLAHASAERGLGPVLTLSQLAAQLGVSVQTLYDLRSQGRGPRGFRVGRELRFRLTEVDAWLERMEAEDAGRHPEGVR
jgi:excisionase family DNA binding protein